MSQLTVPKCHVWYAWWPLTWPPSPGAGSRLVYILSKLSTPLHNQLPRAFFSTLRDLSLRQYTHSHYLNQSLKSFDTSNIMFTFRINKHKGLPEAETSLRFRKYMCRGLGGRNDCQRVSYYGQKSTFELKGEGQALLLADFTWRWKTNRQNDYFRLPWRHERSGLGHARSIYSHALLISNASEPIRWWRHSKFKMAAFYIRSQILVLQ